MIDLNQLQESINKVLIYSQEINTSHINTDWLIDKWYENKKEYINLFGGQLIYEFPEPITFEVDESNKATKISEFCDIISDSYGYQMLADFIYDNKDGFFDNAVEHDTVHNDIIIPKGMKIIKAFKYFIEDKDDLVELQNKASMLIQEDKVVGTLCLSVHPLDYLSSSENTYNWRSCHALDGEYRAGNLSYMMDKSTVVCYLKGAEEANLPNFPSDFKWNSKKWRMLLFMNESRDIFFAGRQYPFMSMSALASIRQAIFTLFAPNRLTYSSWSNAYVDKIEDHYLPDSYVNIFEKLVPITNCIKDASLYHYNDLLNSTCYKPYYMWCLDWYCEAKINPITVGEEVKCIRCGNEPAYSSELMFCEDCALRYTELQSDDIAECYCCGNRIMSADANYLNEDTCLCSNCYNSQVVECEMCGNLMLKEEIRRDDRKICWSCYINNLRRINYG